MHQQPAIPDIYADLVQIVCSDVSVILGLRALSLPQPVLANEQGDEDVDAPPPELKGIVRLNQTQAKIFAIMLKRALKGLEEQHGNIPLPTGFIEQLHPTEDEW